MKTKRKALLISTRQKAKYLAALLQEVGGCTQIRLIKGRHNSLELLCKRLSDYSDTDLFVFDLAAIAERKKEADLVYELKNISEESKQKPIVVYAPDMSREASTAKALLEAGKIKRHRKKLKNLKYRCRTFRLLKSDHLAPKNCKLKSC